MLLLSIPHLPLDVNERNTLDIAKKEKKGYNVTKSREVWNEETKQVPRGRFLSEKWHRVWTISDGESEILTETKLELAQQPLRNTLP